MEKRLYYYTDPQTKQLKKYIYCNLCIVKGPYTEADIGKEIFAKGSAQNPTYYCKQCLTNLKLKQENSDAWNINMKVISDPIKVKNQKLKQEVRIKVKEKAEESKVEQLKQEIKIELIASNNWCVYTLECKDKTLYHGITQNLEKAIAYHNRGSGADYTRLKERRPVTLVSSKPFETKDEAVQFKKTLQ
jgi:putative endonuclease